MRRLGQALVIYLVALVTYLVASGCFGDPPPDPAVAPLEVVAGSIQRPDEPCILNRGELGAGSHEVTVITEAGPATIRIRDGDGQVLLEVEGPDPGQASTPQLVQLDAGTYTVECEPSGGTMTSVTLRVVDT